MTNYVKVRTSAAAPGNIFTHHARHEIREPPDLKTSSAIELSETYSVDRVNYYTPNFAFISRLCYIPEQATSTSCWVYPGEFFETEQGSPPQERH